ncbi:MAG: murein biosynthesis integral membrane protein MurJ [Meiothermus sp.]|uniref:murein biosynthesis integral membrane protein MurJ n=1 Tax=Meiothermus sp. TaxID=1955249 RepID=UPI0025F95AD6|nr:murein biosynthesis integral membrane protein MurJ [Meiothermus sp.]MCS7058863.1 murein biosynthesis integral membrane protein MurJ [Meiothermus sp.]MCS7194911.1 murein biosynthesis integral membrane protein MurJ [Meiothermus sp.]MDW8091280.1 murein biosynthesis integral membrane protein MurJ [Meiothermus sp.]MDW8482522.1 murein biosynthesis integral membrane protein MurJ [Meiothermus sp.]
MSRILRNTLLVMSGTLASRLLGQLRQTILTNLPLPDTLKDAFWVAYRIPNLLRELLAEGAIQNALIPVLAQLPPEEARRFARRFGAFLLGVNLVVLGLGLLFAPQIAGGLLWLSEAALGQASPLRDPEVFEQLVLLVRLTLPFLLAISMAALFSSMLQSGERFGLSSFSPVAFNLGAIGLMLLFPQSVAALGLSVTVGGALQALVQLPGLKGYGLEFRWHPAFRQALARIGPFAFTTSVRQFLNLVLLSILAAYPSAAVTGFQNGELFFTTALGLLAVSPAMAAFPRLSALGGSEAARALLSRLLVRLAVPLAFASAMMVALAPWGVGLVYALTPNFTEANRTFTTQTVTALGLALLPWGLNQLLLRGFYAVGQVGQAVRVTVAVALLNTLGYWLLREQGLFALNLATAAAGWAGLAAYIHRLERLGMVEGGQTWRATLKASLAALPAGLLAHQGATWLGPPGPFLVNLLPLLGGGLVGLAVFAGLARGLGLPLWREDGKRG